MAERAVAFVSPHLDDAVFSCGECIASSAKPVVITIFAGRPEARAALTAWDAECGFAPEDDVVAVRRGEDRAALGVLDARPVWLDFRDDQYGERRSTQAIGEALADVLAREAPTAVYAPLGLFHADHRRASDAALALVDRFPELDWYAYEDAIYRRIPGAVEARLRLLDNAGFTLARHPGSRRLDAHARKQVAARRYASQLRALAARPAHADVFAPEAYWSIAPTRTRA